MPPPSSDRRSDLDWIRVGAFMVLILYHVGMFYVPWPWHVKSERLVEPLQPLMMLVSPWRLTLLFLVSGCATRLLFDACRRRGQGWGTLLRSRLLRLAPPILFGMLVVVPPQTWHEVAQSLELAGVARPAADPALANFWLRYVTGTGGWCGPGGCLSTPTWNHLWFVVYLLGYSVCLIGLLAIPGLAARLQRALARCLTGWGLLVWPVVWLALLRLVVLPHFGITHAFVDDWYNHALSLSAFLFGYFLGLSEETRAVAIRYRRAALLVGIAAWLVWVGWSWSGLVLGAPPSPRFQPLIEVVYAVDQWAFIIAVLGYGGRWLTRGGPVLRYLARGVFAFYIVHQTATIMAARALAPLGLPLGVEAGLVILITGLACLTAFEAARRLGPLGLLLGVRPERASSGRVDPAQVHRSVDVGA